MQFISTILATVPSSKNPAKCWDIRLGRDGNIWCTCPSWKFQRKTPKARSCKHTRAFAASLVEVRKDGAKREAKRTKVA